MPLSRRELFRSAAGCVASATMSRVPALLADRVKDHNTAELLALDRNENPYGPSPGVVAALSNSLKLVSRYPSDDGPLRQALADFHGLSMSNILVGCGSSEIIRATVAAYLG